LLRKLGNKVLRASLLTVIVLGALLGSTIGIGEDREEIQPADPCWVGPEPDAGYMVVPGICEGYADDSPIDPREWDTKPSPGD